MKTCNTLLSALFASLILALATGCDRGLKVTVENESDLSRNNELVTVALPDGFAPDGLCRVVDADGAEVPSQLLHNGTLAFPATVAPRSAAEYRIVKGAPSEPSDTMLAWMVRPDCQDDFAWENQHSGYRLYGPLFRRMWGNVHGYDLWSKRFNAPIVKRLYDLDHGPEQISYHIDHGEGFDGYTVGPTLGAGACALADGDSIFYATAYRDYEVLDFGPLRLSVKFTIDTLDFNGRKVQEIRTVTLDSDEYFNHVSTRFEGLEAPADIVAGIVVHADNPEGYALTDNTIAVVDLSDNVANDNGEIYVGVISPSAREARFVPIDPVKANAVGQALLRSTVEPGESFDYYFGSGWNKGSVASADEWNRILAERLERLRNPLKVTVGR